MAQHEVRFDAVMSDAPGGQRMLLACSCGWSESVLDVADRDAPGEAARRHVAQVHDRRAAAEDRLADEIEGPTRTELTP